MTDGQCACYKALEAARRRVTEAEAAVKKAVAAQNKAELELAQERQERTDLVAQHKKEVDQLSERLRLLNLGLQEAAGAVAHYEELRYVINLWIFSSSLIINYFQGFYERHPSL